MINLDGTGRDMNYDGWRHKTHFGGCPTRKSHVAAIGQAQSSLWACLTLVDCLSVRSGPGRYMQETAETSCRKLNAVRQR